jgi:hypothetical protein
LRTEEPEQLKEPTGIVYSIWSDIILVLCQLLSGVICVVSLAGFFICLVGWIFKPEMLIGAVPCLFVVFLSWAFFVVFHRVRNL